MRLLFLCWFYGVALSLVAQNDAQVKLLSSGEAEKWKTVELGITLPSRDRTFNLYLQDHSRGQNPYTSHFLWMKFIANGKSFVRPAFYMEEAETDEAENRYVTSVSEWPWRVRFSPPDTGTFTCVLLQGETEATAVPTSTGISFHVTAGNRHGILKTTANNPRLQFTDGTPFFILGQNISWNDETILRGYQPFYPAYTSGFYDEFHYIHNLADNGGNYVRITMAPWGMGIEWEEVGIYRQDKAWALDSVIKIAEQRGLYIQLCLDLTTGFDNVPDKSSWHPIRKQFQKDGMTTSDLLTDTAAMHAFDNYITYVHSRWGYSANVAVIELLGEQQRWNGYEGREKNFNNFFTHERELLNTTLHDTLHLLGTSTDLQHIDIYKNPALSFIDVHLYDNNLWCNRKRFFAYNRNGTLSIHKPFLIGEMGIINGPVNGCDPDDWDYCSDISMHNALWSTAFMGNMGAGLYWWQWKNDAFREANYKPLRNFIDNQARGMTDYTEPEFWDGNGLEVYSCHTKDHNFVVGWAHNTSYWWANTLDSCKDRNGNVMIHPRDDDKATVPVDRAGNTFVVEGLIAGASYVVVYFDTRNPAMKIAQNVLKAGFLGRLKVPMPNAGDCAFRIYRNSHEKF